MTFLILHGIQGKAGDHWEQWLHDELVKMGYPVIMPDLPHSQHPDRNEWLQTVKDSLKGIDSNQLVIFGHSLGVATALDFIEQANDTVKALISISGFSHDYGSDLNNYFLKQKQIDFNKVNSHLNRRFVIYGDNDPYVPNETLHDLANELGVTPAIIHNGGHLNTDSGYTSFPYLLEIVDILKKD